MRKFWLMDRHGSEGPTALVETDGRLQIVDVLRFGPSLTSVEDQQEVLDAVIGKVAPTLKPCVKDTSIDVEGIEPHADLFRDGVGGPDADRASRRAASRSSGSQGRVEGGPSRSRSRGER